MKLGLMFPKLSSFAVGGKKTQAPMPEHGQMDNDDIPKTVLDAGLVVQKSPETSREAQMDETRLDVQLLS